MARTRRGCVLRAPIHSPGRKPLRCAGNTSFSPFLGFSSANHVIVPIPARCSRQDLTAPQQHRHLRDQINLWTVPHFPLRLAARRLRTSKPSARTAMQGPVKGCAGVATVHQLRKNGAGNAPYREVVVCTTRSSCSHNPANIFRFRFITLASKWVEQSWRAEWLMEIGTKGATHSLGARFGLHGREKGGAGRRDSCVTVAQATRT